MVSGSQPHEKQGVVVHRLTQKVSVVIGGEWMRGWNGVSVLEGGRVVYMDVDVLAGRKTTSSTGKTDS